MTMIRLPDANGTVTNYTLSGIPAVPPPSEALRFNRRAIAAVHVVPQPLAAVDPWLETALDWDRTMAYRHYLWDLGLGVAEAMDTAQRGMGLDWSSALELIKRSVAEAKTRSDAQLFSGIGTDHLSPAAGLSRDDVVKAYMEQAEAVEAAGSRLIMMASRALAASATGPDDYAVVYDKVLGSVREPVILHWLGEMFDPALEGYWGRGDHWEAMEVCLDVVSAHADKVDGIKVSLLDKEKEITMRARLPKGVRMYTGDDFNYPELIAGDGETHSDALLGIFDAIAPVAAAALQSLAAGNREEFDRLLAPTVPLSRHIFGAPTRFYKTGVVFLAWLNGHQPAFSMVGGQESTRSAIHLAELFRLADQAGLLREPEAAVRRFSAWLDVHAGLNP